MERYDVGNTGNRSERKLFCIESDALCALHLLLQSITIT